MRKNQPCRNRQKLDDTVETNILKWMKKKGKGFLNLSSIVPLNDSNGNNIFITKILCFFKARIRYCKINKYRYIVSLHIF